MTSAAFSVNGTAYSERVAVAGGSTVTLALLSTSGVGPIEWSIESNSDVSLSNPTITSSGSPTGATATFTMPAGDNQGYVVKCVINNGVDKNGATVAEYTARGIVGVVGARGIIPFCTGEEFARHPTRGWTPDLNFALGMFDPVTTFSDDATTADATPEPLTGYTPPGDGTYLVCGIFLAMDQAVGADAVSIVTLTPFKVVSGTCTRIAAPTETFNSDETAGVSVDVDTDGTDIIPEVTGILATDIDWQFTGQVSYLLRP